MCLYTKEVGEKNPEKAFKTEKEMGTYYSGRNEGYTALQNGLDTRDTDSIFR